MMSVMSVSPGSARAKLGLDSDVKIAVTMGSYGFACFYCGKKEGHQSDGSFVQMQEIRINGSSFAYIKTCDMPICFDKGLKDASDVAKAIKAQNEAINAPQTEATKAPQNEATKAPQTQEKCTIS